MPNKIPDLLKQSATEIVSMLKQKTISPSELLDVLEKRIEDIDSTVNALPTLCFERAYARAKAIENGKEDSGLLHGLPVPIKDLTDVSGVRTTFGSLIYKDNISEQSDLLVQHLERQGAVVYAKSNTPEFGTGGNTFNKVFGATRNPWNTNMSASGSSGGAAAALATGMAWLAHGSDMGGSLRNPASFCSIVGMRPSVGRVASSPSSNVIDTLSVSGPMARNVSDLALMFDAMCGREPMDPLSLPAAPNDFQSALKHADKPRSIAFSFDLGFLPVDAKVRQVIAAAIDQLESYGLVIQQKAPDFEALHEVFHILRAQSYASGMGDLLKQHEDVLHPNVVWNIKQGLALTTAEINWANSKRVELTNRVQSFFSEVDILLSPATIVPPYPVDQDHVSVCDGHEFDNYYQWLSAAYAFTTTLCPALSLPCGFTDDGLPVGLQVSSATYKDAEIISAALQIEEILDLSRTTPINPIAG